MFSFRQTCIFAFITVTILIISCAKEKALEVKPPDPCNKAYTFTADIKPIFATRCAIGQCHVSGSMYAPFVATDYDTLDYFINSGRLLIALKHTGAIKMPRNDSTDALNIASTQLPDSIITKIECWVEQGFPE